MFDENKGQPKRKRPRKVKAEQGVLYEKVNITPLKNESNTRVNKSHNRR